MITKEIVQEAANNGLTALKNLFEKLPKDDALKALGILVVLGIAKTAIDAVKDIVQNKMQ